MTRTVGRRRHRWSVSGLAAAVAVASGLVVAVAVPAQAAEQDGDGWGGNSANPSGGQDYYVDASGGSDSADGTTPASAWSSLDKVNATTFEPGDRILLKGGETWEGEQLWPKGSGTAEAPIAIDAYGDEAGALPYIATNGNVPSPFREDGTKNPETVGLTGAVVLRNQEHVSVANLELSNDDDFATDITEEAVVRDGVAVSINADLLEPGVDTVMDGIEITDLFVHDVDGPSYWQKIHYGGVSFQVFGEKEYGEYPEGGHHFEDVRIENNSFEKVELHAVQFAFNWFGASQGQADESGKWHEGWEQLWVRDRDLYSRDVYIGHNYAESIGQGPYQFANTKNLLAEYNEANGWLERYSQVSAGLYLWAGADSVMRFNEIYDGPANEYDATAWDLEFTNFDVRYEYNYSHDNQGGWMSYMGNSSNSVARYNLSVNDNGVIWKNMLSTNYSPTYVLNNVFVYDGAELEWFHDEVLKDTVYFANNVFYNTSTTDTTEWFRKPDALARGVFSNNAYYEASGTYSDQQPQDDRAVIGDPGFVGDPADYARDAGVDAILDSAAPFRLREDSPLIDAGRYNERLGQDDFFGNQIYYGEAPDIGIHEQPLGELVEDPVDTDPIEEEGGDDRDNLALGAQAVASSTHPANDYGYSADNLVDGNGNTRWAAADDATYPLTVDIDFGEPVELAQVRLDEYTDAGTNPRVREYSLQRWDEATASWVTIAERDDGIGHGRVVDVDPVALSRLRLSITSLQPGEVYAPTLTEIAAYGPEAGTSQPAVTPGVGLFDRNADVAGSELNTVEYTVDPDGDELTAIRYVTTSGALVGTLDEDDYERVEDDSTEGGLVVRLTPAFFADKELGTSGLRFEFASGATAQVDVVIVDTTELAELVATAWDLPEDGSPESDALQDALATGSEVLAAANRTVAGTGNDRVVHADVMAAADGLSAAIEAYEPHHGAGHGRGLGCGGPGGTRPDHPGPPEAPGPPSCVLSSAV